jgi:hypothetical protein
MKRLSLLFHPPAEVSTKDTSLRYTDILFGFVIKELFVRLQNWSHLPGVVQWHLLVGTTLVLGSWIGYRRSLNRLAYEVKFFNLPFFRFLVDQLMLVLYFRIAVLTSADGVNPPNSDLASQTLTLVIWVFALYVVWDSLGIWTAHSTKIGATGGFEPRYPVVADGKMTANRQKSDWHGFWITLIVLLLLVLCSLVIRESLSFILLVPLLVIYRLAKEVRTSWRQT